MQLGAPYTVIWKTTDGGNTWSPKLNVSSNSYNCYDLEITPSGRVYAIVAWPHFNSDILIYYSDDNGETWTQLAQPRIPLRVIYSTYFSPSDIRIKYHNGKLYLWGAASRPPYSTGGPLFHTECWFYDENTSQWKKWDILTNPGFVIEKGPGPLPGQTYLYLGTAYTSGTAKVIRINQPIGNLQKKMKKSSEVVK
ncbi:MAG: sialidase family protein [candidate division WOR-3 bacterium]